MNLSHVNFFVWNMNLLLIATVTINSSMRFIMQYQVHKKSWFTKDIHMAKCLTFKSSSLLLEFHKFWVWITTVWFYSSTIFWLIHLQSSSFQSTYFWATNPMLITWKFDEMLFQLYTHAIQEDSTKDEFYVNRSHAYMKLEKYQGRVLFALVLCFLKFFFSISWKVNITLVNCFCQD